MLGKAATAAHAKYRAKLQPCSEPKPDIRPGSLVLLYRPRTHKLFVRSTGPYLVIALRGSEATLQNLATGATLCEHVSNVRMLHWSDSLGA